MDDMVHERFLRLTERPHQKLDDKNIHDGTYIRVTYYYKIAQHSLTRKLVYLQKIVASQPTPTYITTWYRSGAQAINAAWTTLHMWLARIHFPYLRFTGHARVNTSWLCDHDHHRMVDAYTLYVAIQNVLK